MITNTSVSLNPVPTQSSRTMKPHTPYQNPYHQRLPPRSECFHFSFLQHFSKFSLWLIGLVFPSFNTRCKLALRFSSVFFPSSPSKLFNFHWLIYLFPVISSFPLLSILYLILHSSSSSPFRLSFPFLCGLRSNELLIVSGFQIFKCIVCPWLRSLQTLWFI